MTKRHKLEMDAGNLTERQRATSDHYRTATPLNGEALPLIKRELDFHAETRGAPLSQDSIRRLRNAGWPA